MMKTRIALTALVLTSLFLAFGEAAAAPVGSGDDGYQVSAGPNNLFDLSTAPVPADFFGPGSDPFDGIIASEGATGGVDTTVRRPNPTIDLDPIPTTDPAVQIEIVALQLRSVSPIVVTYNAGQSPEQWDVDIDLSTIPPPPGQMTITKDHANGGTFTAEFPVQPLFTFTKVGDPSEVRTLDTGLEGRPALDFQSFNPPLMPWNTNPPTGFPPGDFFPGVDPITPGSPQPLVFGTAGGDFIELQLIIPEPSTFVLAVIGLIGLLAWRRRRRTKD